jgi:hypothetical protein
MEDLPRYKKSEWELIERKWISQPFVYSITQTIAAKNPSLGDVFHNGFQTIERIAKQSSSLSRCLFFVCQHYSDSRPHIHGFVDTDLSQRKVQKLIVGGFGKVEKLPDFWSGYIEKQAVRGLHLTDKMEVIFDDKIW